MRGRRERLSGLAADDVRGLRSLKFLRQSFALRSSRRLRVAHIDRTLGTLFPFRAFSAFSASAFAFASSSRRFASIIALFSFRRALLFLLLLCLFLGMDDSLRPVGFAPPTALTGGFFALGGFFQSALRPNRASRGATTAPRSANRITRLVPELAVFAPLRPRAPVAIDLFSFRGIVARVSAPQRRARTRASVERARERADV